MKLSIFALILVVLAVVAFSKDKFQTTPKIEVKDYNTKAVPRNGQLIVRLNYFDKEGDLPGVVTITTIPTYGVLTFNNKIISKFPFQFNINEVSSLRYYRTISTAYTE